MYGRRTAPWRDEDFFKTVPELFTIDLDQTLAFPRRDHGPDSDLCECDECQEWFESMGLMYTNPIFCVRKPEGNADLGFFRSNGMVWPPEEVMISEEQGSETQDGKREVQADFVSSSSPQSSQPSESVVCLYQSELIICIGRNKALGVPSLDDRIHIRRAIPTGFEEEVFTVRAYSSGE